jgi:DNA-binding LytR/AlgR family response regulator
LVNLKEITRLEGEGSYTYVHLSDGDKHVLSYHLGYFEPRLNDDFFRVHKSHIINLQFINRVHRTDGLIVEMRDGAHIEVSRRLKGSFLERIKGGSATL